MTCPRIGNVSNTAGVTCGAGTDYPSRDTAYVTCGAGTDYPFRVPGVTPTPIGFVLLEV